MTIRDLSVLIKTAKGALSSDPQSGGILKVLGAAGFAEKIMNGSDAGRTYQVLHAPGERNFVVMEKWVDKEGGHRTMYYPFVITEEKIQETNKQDTNTATSRPRSLRDAIPISAQVAAPVASSDIFSNVLDDFEHSLDEFLSFAKA